MKTVYIPNGPKNLAPLFSVNFDDIEEYTVELLSNTLTVLATTTLNRIDSCDQDTVRIHFLNSLGTIDAMNFKKQTIEHAPKSATSQTPTPYPLVKTGHSLKRFNVNANETWVATSIEYDEDQMEWVKELLDSPMAWMEWKGTQGQADSYIPIVIIDQKTLTLKEEERFTYEVQLQFNLSNERFIIRN